MLLLRPLAFRSERAVLDAHLAVRYELPFGPGKQHAEPRPRCESVRRMGASAASTRWMRDVRSRFLRRTIRASLGGGTGMRPNATGVSAALPGGPQICDSCAYFNTAAFMQTPQYAFGNVSRYLPDVNNPTA